ncbi:hypothetical protein JRQ81_014952 [Phrynocephalus forsythii]|uniref:Fatty-acid amide hydrolase 1 n=1 Tax=Phrynocephalus forsythii TaxID=171643 RepID=A0A9Q0Y0X5_9SAUR|nr:hypothetical protein JRQ81_014952 [Phrynocephalus forsythii]
MIASDVCIKTRQLFSVVWDVVGRSSSLFCQFGFPESLDYWTIYLTNENPGVKAASILSLSLVELSAKLKDGSLTPESVLYTYIEKALEVTRQINCVTDFLPECEEQLQEVKKREKGLLYGVPVSIKENVACKGYPNTFGLVKFLDCPEQEDSVIVKVLKKQGAIPFVKTNTSQAILNIDCGNTLFGQTLNPFNHKKTSGGSSGGEAALVGAGGSALGIGTDVAASIRVPCGFCGVCGFKPTGYRISDKGATSPVAGMNSVTSVTGPIAKDVDGLVLCMKALLCDEMFMLDSAVPPLPFNEEIYSSSKPLRIGYYDGDGYFEPSPSMRRAVQETRKFLQEAGHTLIPFTPPRIDFLVDELFTKALYADGSSTLVEKFDGEFVDSTWTNQLRCCRMPNLLKRILSFIFIPVFPRIARHMHALLGIGSVKDFWKNNVDQMVYRDEFIAEWRKLNLDVVLCPALGPAFNLGYAGKLFVATTYTHLYNVLNFPAGVVPVTTVTQADEDELKLYKGHYGDPWDKRMKEAVEAFLALKWMARERIKRQIKEARRKRDHGLEQMEKAIQKFKQENPGIQSGHILSLPLEELDEKLKEGTLSPETVLYTYMEKALTITQETNCVCHFIPECEQQLQEMKKQKTKGLLHGIPVSIKEHIGYKGHLLTCGLAHFLGVLPEEDSVLVNVLKRQGAIPFVFTNVPQSLFNYDCSNPIFGQTVNPLDHKRSPGGSSGGEGALIAGGGSILGFGSDIGGSVRLPSSFCGIFHLLISITVAATVGPMARDVDSLAFCMKALLCEDMFQLDPSVPPMPFKEEVYASSEPLRIGYYDTDDYFLLPPCVRRAVQKTRTLLQEVGHTLIPFTPPAVDYAMDELFLKGVFADGGSVLLSLLEKDIVDPSLKPQVTWLRIQKTVKKVLAKIVKPWFPRLASHLNALCGVRSVKDIWEHHGKVMAYRKKFMDEWRKWRLDVVLCPVLGPAFLLGYPAKLIPAISCTMLYNVLNFPAGVVPVATVTEADEEELRHYEGLCGDLWDKKLKEAVEGAVGLPVAVQCVSLPWQEELCLRFMKEVEKLSQEERQKKAM